VAAEKEPCSVAVTTAVVEIVMVDGAVYRPAGLTVRRKGFELGEREPLRVGVGNDLFIDYVDEVLDIHSFLLVTIRQSDPLGPSGA
jgi:hypothetical protein